MDNQVQQALNAAREKFQDQKVNPNSVHPVNAARELKGLGITLSAEQGSAFLEAWSSQSAAREGVFSQVARVKSGLKRRKWNNER